MKMNRQATSILTASFFVHSLQHVCADTMRSVAVFVAAGIATAHSSIPPAMADAFAALAVSVIILCSMLPLLHGLFWTAVRIHTLTRNPPNIAEV
jgi:Co/Zn/Cd efflux system component